VASGGCWIYRRHVCPSVGESLWTQMSDEAEEEGEEVVRRRSVRRLETWPRRWESPGKYPWMTP
jgi:hypothetical protein